MEGSGHVAAEPYGSSVAVDTPPTTSDPFTPPSTVDENLYDAPTPETPSPAPSPIRNRRVELVRLENLPAGAHVEYRENFRRARLLFESLRMSEEEKGYMPDPKEVKDTDSYAARKMREHKVLSLGDNQLGLGSIPGLTVGDIFFYRSELGVLGLHRPHEARTDYVRGHSTKTSKGEPTATSIVFSESYKTDRFQGDTIYYTGHGGRKPRVKAHVRDQTLEESANKALDCNRVNHIDVRVIRQLKTNSGGIVYVYEGLYHVAELNSEVDEDSGYKVLVFKLVRKGIQPQTLIDYATTLSTLPLEKLPEHYYNVDLAHGTEKAVVYVHNEVDGNSEPFDFTYIRTSDFPQHVYARGDHTGCLCYAPCLDNGCPCAVKGGGLFAYDRDGILFRGMPHIFECGPTCGCPHTCRNRVTQQGLRSKLVVFRTSSLTWGVRSLDIIQAGSFICEYAGVVTPEGEPPNRSCIYPARFPRRWKEWGDISRVDADYACPPSDPPLDFVMDVSEKRNAASYIRHSSTPNVFVQLVFHEHDSASLPHVMLFAMENIPPMRELTLDYGEAVRGDGSTPLEEAR